MKFTVKKKRKSRGRGQQLQAGHWRIQLIQVVFYFVAAGLLVRLVHIQVVNHDKYGAIAHEQYTREYKHKAPRGLIYDRNLTMLALNKERFDLGVHKRSVSDLNILCARLAGLLNVAPEVLFEKFQTQSSFVVLFRDIDEGKAQIIQALKMPGVKVTKSTERLYPFKETLAQVIGFADIDGKGLSGIELQFDSKLKGNDGWSILQKDARGNNIMPISSRTRDSQKGDNIVLTIDHVIQTIAEEELSLSVKKYNAKGGTVVITNPTTGEILAMAAAPGFDANLASTTNPDAWRIRGITDIFEPGSTFKIVTLMQALRDTTIGADDIIFCENGKYKMYGETINDPEKHAWLSIEDIFIHSSNIGTAKLAIKLGKEKLFKVSRDFGFGNKTGIELPGELSGILKKPTDWSKFSLAAMSYGHEVATTVLQMAMAYGAIANGGLLMKPVIVKEIQDNGGKRQYEFTPQTTRKVMNPKIAAKMSAILKKVVDEGTGIQAKIPNASIAGKTGTAQKPRSNGKGYSNTDFVASFVGYYPAEHAKLLIYVTLDEPYPIHSGGSVAAPTVKKMLKRIMEVYETPRPVPTPQMAKLSPPNRWTVPNLVGRRIEVAEKIFEERGIQYRTNGEGTYIKSQENMDAEDKIVLELQHAESDSLYGSMPSLIGLSLRKAIVELSMHGLRAKVDGHGLVTGQQPAAGSNMKIGSRCYLECKPVVSVNLLVN